ncbi:hypothetical protein QF044_001158 [Chryseobacterium sp. W4I1]|nr:hypothetical protein [Chryseobacterium sp. W4I1]
MFDLLRDHCILSQLMNLQTTNANVFFIKDIVENYLEIIQ